MRSTEPTLANAVREGAHRAGLSIRQLARASGVSAAQINRIRAGEVERPELDTIVGIARALGRNPNLLFIVCGHVRYDEARALLRQMFADGSELVEVWKFVGNDVKATREVLEDPQTSEPVIRQIAFDVFLGPEAEENLWQDPFLGTIDREARELLQMWTLLTSRRKTRVLDFVRDQVDLSRRDDADELSKEFPDYGKP